MWCRAHYVPSLMLWVNFFLTENWQLEPLKEDKRYQFGDSVQAKKCNGYSWKQRQHVQHHILCWCKANSAYLPSVYFKPIFRYTHTHTHKKSISVCKIVKKRYVWYSLYRSILLIETINGSYQPGAHDDPLHRQQKHDLIGIVAMARMLNMGENAGSSWISLTQNLIRKKEFWGPFPYSSFSPPFFSGNLS